jgi:hypothetical protein
MTYKNNFVAVIKANGKILREQKDTVYIPFNSEYSILLKNLETVRALVHISIDGECVTSGGLILEPNSELELERYIRDNNLTSGNKFRFINRTENIEKHRGIKVSDGLVRIEYNFEKIVQRNVPKTWNQNILRSNGLSGDNWHYTSAVNMQAEPFNMDEAGFTVTNSCVFTSSTSSTSGPQLQNSQTAAINDAGITVPGGVSKQQFTYGAWFPTEQESHVIVLQLKGDVNNKPVVKPITVEFKPKCVTCGKVNKIKNKFCSECGTALVIL